MSKETSSKFFLILSESLNPTSSFIKQNLPELLEMNAQMPSLNTKLAMETASQLKQPSAPQAQVAIPSLTLNGWPLKKLISKNLALQPPNTALA